MQRNQKEDRKVKKKIIISKQVMERAFSIPHSSPVGTQSFFAFFQRGRTEAHSAEAQQGRTRHRVGSNTHFCRGC